MSIFFNTKLLIEQYTMNICGNVGIINYSNKLEVSFIDENQTVFKTLISIDLDIIKNLTATIIIDNGMHTGNDAYLSLSGEINDSDVEFKLKSGIKFHNRALFFKILKEHYNSIAKNFSNGNSPYIGLKEYTLKEKNIKNFTFFNYQKDYLSWILGVESDINSGKNYFDIPKLNTLKTPGISYDLEKSAIFFIEEEQQFLSKNKFKGINMVLGQGLGKTTIIAGLLALSYSPGETYGKTIDGKYLESKSSLVICDPLDIQRYLYSLKHMNNSIIVKIIKNEKDYKNISYLDLIQSDVVLITSKFLSIIRNNSELFNFSDVEHYYNDTIKDANLLSKVKPELNLIKFKRIVLDIDDPYKLIGKIKKMSCKSYICSSSEYQKVYSELLFEDSSPYNIKIHIDIVKKKYDKVQIYKETGIMIQETKPIPYTILSKEKILLKIYKSLYSSISMDDFLVSPESYCRSLGIKTVVTSDKNSIKYHLGDHSSVYLSNFQINEECSICMEDTDDKVITICGHTFCPVCIGKSLKTIGCCPLCRKLIIQHNYIYLIKKNEIATSKFSSKIKALVSLLNSIELNGKSIIYCKSRYIFSKISEALDNYNIQFINTTDTKKKFSNIVKNFTDSSSLVKILLVSGETKIDKSDLSSINNIILTEYISEDDNIIKNIIERTIAISSQKTVNMYQLQFTLI